MTSHEVLSMYENLAGLTTQMSLAAQAGDWSTLSRLEKQCASQVSAVATGVPALAGAPRMRKIDLLKQIMANDRAIGDVTAPWMNPVSKAMAAH
jgi:flagellar protein FliT